MPNLKQCPHGCTGTPTPLIFTYTESPRYRGCVTCSECGAAGGVVNGNDEAAVTAEACVLWNRRAVDPQTEKAIAVERRKTLEKAAKIVEGAIPGWKVTEQIAASIRALKESPCTVES